MVPTDDIWKLLYKHVQSHYPSLKQAFLEIDAVSSNVLVQNIISYPLINYICLPLRKVM